MLTVYIGFDDREPDAYHVAEKSLRNQTGHSCRPMPLNAERLAAYGLLRRPQDRRGQTYDIISNAPQSTDFAISRFLVPHIHQQGWALFVDSDVVFLGNPNRLLSFADPSKAVMVVKHPPLTNTETKMDGQAQLLYSRKNWSSVVLWNCGHPANQRLSLHDVNERPGRWLHAFSWLNDAEIGELPEEYNWLVNVRPKPDYPVIAHFTEGGPFTPGWKGAPHDDIWLRAAGRL